MHRITKCNGFRGLAAALGLFAVASAASARTAEWPIAARHLGGALGDVGYRVFRSGNQWRNALANAPGTQANPELPAVDWSREMVITASAGLKPTTGYSVRITSVTRVGDQIIVNVRETRPRPGEMQGQMITYPSDAVAVKRTTDPVVFIVNGQRRTAMDARRTGTVLSGTRPGTRGVPMPDTRGLAKTLLVVREEGGIAGRDRQSVIHLFGRPVQRGEVTTTAREMREVKVTGPDMRRVEQAVRSSGFMSLMSRYMAPRPGADLMTRTIQVQMDGQTKSVAVQDGADAPRAFETVWAAIQDALNSKGTVTRPWQSAS